ncbi:MAG: hypothetical protein M1813_000898 [Trichoglossum hirsutum]|nr:MAG: hypothetical protein M1813_000898 [Trichoglossum hirsutum]
MVNRCCLLCSPGSKFNGIKLDPGCVRLYVARYAWRVVTSYSQGDLSSGMTTTEISASEMRDLISSHLMQEHVLTPFVSLTNSLLWALNWMRSMNNKGATDIELYLIDTRKIPYDCISPAWVLKEYYKVPNCGKVWHDDPAHELLVYYHIPEEAVIGKARLDDNRIYDFHDVSLIDASGLE